VMPPEQPAARIPAQLPGGKHPLPNPLAARLRILPRQRFGQPNPLDVLRSILLVQFPLGIKPLTSLVHRFTILFGSKGKRNCNRFLEQWPPTKPEVRTPIFDPPRPN
jgi:hypothetical protein